MTSFHFLQEISHHVEEMRSETEPPTFVLIVELQTPWVHSLRVHSLNQARHNEFDQLKTCLETDDFSNSSDIAQHFHCTSAQKWPNRSEYKALNNIPFDDWLQNA